jgi:ubiquinone/menaquinone biosynthesis C-methylase UbiE
MGSQGIQGHLWGQRPKDWAAIQEKTGKDGYVYVLALLDFDEKKLLDVGCGSGLFSSLAYIHGAEVTGIDASEQLVAEARQREPAVEFLTGEMESLPFADDSFDLVCGFNSFQYAADVKNALTEARRVLKDNGRLVVMIWGNKEECEAATYLKAVGSLLPPPPPGASGPFALSENELLETLLEQTGYKIISTADIPGMWDYPDVDTALKGLISAGPVTRAIENSGFDKVHQTIAAAVVPYIKDNGHVVYHNKYRIVIAEK